MAEKNEQINIRVTGYQKKELERKARERGVSVTAYILEKALKPEKGCIYDSRFRDAVYQVCSLTGYVSDLGSDPELTQKYEEGVRALWQYLR